MVADPDAYIRLLDEAPAAWVSPARRRAYLAAPKRLAWKTALLAITTLAFAPILLMKHERAGAVYVATLFHIRGDPRACPFF